jgi:hypothetical protein
MLTHRLLLGTFVLSLSLSSIACASRGPSAGASEPLHDSGWRVTPYNNPSSTPTPPTRIAADSRRDRMRD